MDLENKFKRAKIEIESLRYFDWCVHWDTIKKEAEKLGLDEKDGKFIHHISDIFANHYKWMMEGHLSRHEEANPGEHIKPLIFRENEPFGAVLIHGDTRYPLLHVKYFFDKKRLKGFLRADKSISDKILDKVYKEVYEELSIHLLLKGIMATIFKEGDK